MHIAPLLVAVTFAAGTPSVQPALTPSTVTLAIVDSTLEQTLATMAKVTGVTITLDDSVSAETKSRKVPHVNFVNARLDDALQFLAKFSELEVVVVDERSVRIRPKQ